MSEVRLRISLPLDDDGFLRRACPSCVREFKWLHSEGAGSTEPEGPTPSSYHCPYCNAEAPAGAWFTDAQAAFGRRALYDEVIAPELEDFKREVEGTQIDGPISFSARLNITPPPLIGELTEPNDMRRVGFSCHPHEPLKIAEDWTDEVHCLVCGSTV